MSSPVNQSGAETLTTSSTAIGVTASLTDGKARHAIFQVLGSAVRFRADGTAPTSTTGLRVEAGGTIEFMDSPSYEGVIRNIQFILDGSGAANGTVECAYYN